MRFVLLLFFFVVVKKSNGLPTDYCTQRIIGKFCRREFSGAKSVLCFDSIFVNGQPCYDAKCPDLSRCKKIIFCH